MECLKKLTARLKALVPLLGGPSGQLKNIVDVGAILRNSSNVRYFRCRSTSF